MAWWDVGKGGVGNLLNIQSLLDRIQQTRLVVSSGVFFIFYFPSSIFEMQILLLSPPSLLFRCLILKELIGGSVNNLAASSDSLV